MTSNYFFYTIFSLLIIYGTTKIFLEWLNKQNSKNSAKVANKTKSLEDSIKYTLAKTHFAMVKIIFETILLILLLILPVFATGYAWTIETFGKNPFSFALYFYGLILCFQMSFLPFEIYHTFFLEERFGFNTQSFKNFWIDKIKSIAIGMVFLIPFFAGIFYLDSILELDAGKTAMGTFMLWLKIMLFIVLFQFLIQFLFPRIILPIFFKLSPLKDEKLKEELFHLAKKTNFSAKDILVIDGSRRSKHSNAFFAGIGKSRIVVLFDTLIEQLNINELKAVLAHEIGHYKKKHILKMIFSSIFEIALSLFFIIWLTKSDVSLLSSFSFEDSLFTTNALSLHIVIFFFFSSTISLWISLIKNVFSRKYEFEADQFAYETMKSNEEMISALEKLHKENLANLFPNKIYCAFYYSHPTLQERKKALLNLSKV